MKQSIAPGVDQCRNRGYRRITSETYSCVLTCWLTGKLTVAQCVHVEMAPSRNTCTHISASTVRACTYMRTYVNTYMHTCIRVHGHACMYARKHVCICARKYACMHACMHACIDACMYVCMYARLSEAFLSPEAEEDEVDEC